MEYIFHINYAKPWFSSKLWFRLINVTNVFHSYTAKSIFQYVDNVCTVIENSGIFFSPISVFIFLQVSHVKKPHNLRLGMKLEAVHPNDSTKICVATVSRIFDHNYVLVKIDNLISIQDDVIDSFAIHKGSPCIFPVGFCLRNGLSLEMPEGLLTIVGRVYVLIRKKIINCYDYFML